MRVVRKVEGTGTAGLYVFEANVWVEGKRDPCLVLEVWTSDGRAWRANAAREKAPGHWRISVEVPFTCDTTFEAQAYVDHAAQMKEGVSANMFWDKVGSVSTMAVMDDSIQAVAEES